MRERERERERTLLGHVVFLYWCMRPEATGVCGLKLLVNDFRCECIRSSGTSSSGFKLLVYPDTLGVSAYGLKILLHVG